MPTYKLHYFDGRGRGETCRMMFTLAGVQFEDVRYTSEEWKGKKEEMPFKEMPVLEIIDGGKTTLLPQSYNIARYLGREFNLLGKSSLEIALRDGAVEAMRDCIQAIPWHEQDEKKKEKLKQEALNDKIKPRLKLLDCYLLKHDLVGGPITWADIELLTLSNVLEVFVDAKALEDSPNLRKINEKVAAEPKIKAWIEKRPKTDY